MKKIYLLLLGSTLSIATMAQQSFTSSGTFTVPAGVTNVTVEVIGAGGKGGNNGAGGGGGGGYAAGLYPVVPGATYAVVVGQATSGNGTSSVAGLGLSATKGGNGISLTNPQIIGGGGAGGVGSGGQINRTGGAGGGGYYTYFGGGGGGAGGPAGNGGAGGNSIAWTGVCQTPGGIGGISGGLPGGNGGKGAGFTDANCSVTDPSAVGANYGGGGGGANGNGGAASNGSNGFVQFSWCNPIGAPTGDATQTFCSSAMVSDLVAQGTNVQWYATATGGTALTASTPLTNNTTYYAEQDAEPCETVVRLPVMVNITTVDITTTTAVTTITSNQVGATYVWIDCATNMAIAGQTGQSYTPTLTGSYAVIITNATCVDTSACVAISFVGVNELDKNANFKIFPNPATEVLSIEVTDLTHGSTFSIVDQNGKKVKTGTLIVGENKLNIKELKNGLYILKIGEKDSQTFKVIKE
ncbi:MAG: T9SS type A sorting domain-containing protein [Crocinitomicaceae bacterium]|nr:T9SS type A sorting domain-containing protein [Crocinitomicaceae bacterium]